MSDTQDPRDRYIKALAFSAAEILADCRGISNREPCSTCQETSKILNDLAHRIAQAQCVSGHGTDTRNVLNIIIPFDE